MTGWSASSLTVLANVGITAPIFWVGILLIYFFGLKLGWLPIQGYTSPLEDPEPDHVGWRGAQPVRPTYGLWFPPPLSELH